MQGSRASDLRKDFFQCMQQHKILSTSSVISPQQERTEPLGHRPCKRGGKSSLRREPDLPADPSRLLFGNVTEPNGMLTEFQMRCDVPVSEQGKAKSCAQCQNAFNTFEVPAHVRG